MRNRIIPIAITALAALSILSGQTGKTVWDGIYSSDQAVRGEAVYKQECASCHGEDLLGSGPMPALVGEDFRKQWDGQSVGDLYERMRVSMPADHPGKLSPEQNANVLAFLLKSNDFPAGKTELKGDAAALKSIRFEAVRK